MFAKIVLGLTVLCAGCSGTSERLMDPSAVVVAPSPWPTPEIQAPGAPPRIVALWLNETDLRPGHRWSGKIVTSTNVASIEVRTESFSFTAKRTVFGKFEFAQDILDIVPQYRRSYVLHVIARNSSGASEERLVPIVIH